MCTTQVHCLSFHPAEIFTFPDTTWDASDTYLGQATINAISSLSLQTISQSITIPSTITNGTWYILFKADADNTIVESNETTI